MSSEQGLYNQRECVGVAAALTSLSIIVVTLRSYTRVFIVRNFGKDDYTMLVALLLAIGYFVAIIVLRDNGLGFSGKELTPGHMVKQVQTTLTIQIIYYLVINAIKISILFFYLRIAANKRLEVLSKNTIYFLATFCSICIICSLAQCIPLHKMWDLTNSVSGTCINNTAFFYTTSSLHILIDIWILVLPLPTLQKVRRPAREKAALLAIFSLGAFSTIASIVRLHAIRIYTESADPFFDSVPINVWSQVEVNVGIWCASIPALKALFVAEKRERRSVVVKDIVVSNEDDGGSEGGNMLGWIGKRWSKVSE